MSVDLTLPFPPSDNAYVRHSNGMHFLTAKAKQYRVDVLAAVKQARVDKLSGRLQITLTVCPPDRRKRDVMNYQKGLIDSLQHAGLIEDDEQFDRVLLERGPIVAGGYVLIRVMQHERQHPQQPALIPAVPVSRATKRPRGTPTPRVILDDASIPFG